MELAELVEPFGFDKLNLINQIIEMIYKSHD